METILKRTVFDEIKKYLQQIIDTYVKKDIRDLADIKDIDKYLFIKEIDFILKIKRAILPVEVKLNFEQFDPTAVQYFHKHYGINKYKVVGLNGKPKNEFYIYPWDVWDCFAASKCITFKHSWKSAIGFAENYFFKT